MKKGILIFLICFSLGSLVFLNLEKISVIFKDYSEAENGSVSSIADNTNFKDDFKDVCHILENESTIIELSEFTHLKEEYLKRIDSSKSVDDYIEYLKKFMGNIENPHFAFSDEFQNISPCCNAVFKDGKILISDIPSDRNWNLEKGDQLITADGIDILKWLSIRTAFYAGSREDKINSSISDLFRKISVYSDSRELKVLKKNGYSDISLNLKNNDLHSCCNMEKREDIALIKISGISQKSIHEFKEIIPQIVDVKGLVLDIRNCSSGLESEANEISDLMMQFCKKNSYDEESIPVMILTGKNTKNAGTHIAATLRSYDKCILMGEATGPGFNDTKSYRTKSGTVIRIQKDTPIFLGKAFIPQKKGIKPHIDISAYIGVINSEKDIIDIAIEEFHRTCFNIELLKRPVTEYGEIVMENIISYSC